MAAGASLGEAEAGGRRAKRPGSSGRPAGEALAAVGLPALVAGLLRERAEPVTQEPRAARFGAAEWRPGHLSARRRPAAVPAPRSSAPGPRRRSPRRRSARRTPRARCRHCRRPPPRRPCSAMPRPGACPRPPAASCRPTGRKAPPGRSGAQHLGHEGAARGGDPHAEHRERGAGTAAGLRLAELPGRGARPRRELRLPGALTNPDVSRGGLNPPASPYSSPPISRAISTWATKAQPAAAIRTPNTASAVPGESFACRAP
jgi:hypothetical protein